MAGMNLNPYNLNNNNTNPQDQKKMYSNHYAGEYKFNKEDDEEEEEKKKAREKYLKQYGYQTTNVDDMNLDKPVKKEKKNNYLLIIGLGLGGIILIIVCSLL